MLFSNDELNGFAVWLLNTDSHAQVEEPAELRQIIKGFVRDMVENYRELL